ncbi:hypothetical protein SCHPADRAFT_995590 [Schizopora paradoxa]|uniref:DUF6533 domain-containing protein n=1 Tax=Schizopora paradoxa TaxID=27342 RepID=A0A0H2SFH0_9AGAM|nr:hypothetical protein SCHPADRAFT_995590 [Schizopora paradoxa]
MLSAQDDDYIESQCRAWSQTAEVEYRFLPPFSFVYNVSANSVHGFLDLNSQAEMGAYYDGFEFLGPVNAGYTRLSVHDRCIAIEIISKPDRQLSFFSSLIAPPVATTCFVTYEHLINLDYEIRYLWQRRFTFGSCLLFFCRYFPIAQIYVCIVEYILTTDLLPSNCKSLLKANSGLVYLQFCLSNLVLYTRTYAVWAGNKRVLMTLMGTYIISAAGTAYTVYRYVHGISVLGLRLWSGCIFLVTDHTIFYALLGSVLMESFQIQQGGRTKVSLLTVMAQDGMAYFIFNTMCTIANMIVLQRASADYRDFLVTTQSCVQNVLCARLFFHMQTVYRNGPGTSTMSSTTFTDVNAKEFEMREQHRREPKALRVAGGRLFAEDATWTGLTTTHSDDSEIL